MRALHAEQRPRSATRNDRDVSAAATVWPHAGSASVDEKVEPSAGAIASPRRSAHSSCQPRSIIFGKRWMTTSETSRR